MFFFTLIPATQQQEEANCLFVEFLRLVSVKASGSVLRAAHCASLLLMNAALHQQGSKMLHCWAHHLAGDLCLQNLYENGWLFTALRTQSRSAQSPKSLVILFAFETRWRFGAV
jgi:hypothetical protein